LVRFDAYREPVLRTALTYINPDPVGGIKNNDASLQMSFMYPKPYPLEKNLVEFLIIPRTNTLLESKVCIAFEVFLVILQGRRGHFKKFLCDKLHVSYCDSIHDFPPVIYS